MVNKIDQQKKVTRDALNYIAEVKRDRSMFTTPNKASISVDQLESISIDNTLTELDKSNDKSQVREDKLMDLIKKCEIPKWAK